MIDLTNKTVEEVNILIQKYASLLEVIEQKQYIPQFAVTFDIAVNYVNRQYNDANSSWKAWAIVVIKKLFDKINNESDIYRIIDEFYVYINSEAFQSYLNSIVMFVDDYARESNCVSMFINHMTKKGGI
jgi:hypothetical protein